MDTTHLHLMLNHVPVLGALFAALTVAVALLWKNQAVFRVGLGMLVLAAVSAFPVFFTGEPAEESIERLADFSERRVEAHEDAARIALMGLSAMGLVALVGLVRTSRREVPRRFAVTLLVATFALSGWLAWTAQLGGKIRHTEIAGQLANNPPDAAGEDDSDD